MSSQEIAKSGFLPKWSSRPANHKANRIRNNQRRHRERVKDHIAHLESTLSETQIQLHNALQTIENLRTELKGAYTLPSAHGSTLLHLQHDGIRGGHPSNGLPLPSSINREIRSVQLPTNLRIEDPQREIGQECCEVERIAVGTNLEERPRASHQAKPEWNSLPFNTSAPCTANSSVIDEFSAYESRFSLKAPVPLESTTRCRDAFKIIQEQNFIKAEPSVIRVWLESGFRMAIVEGDGCRVDNKLLFALLDYINPS
ncbi:hypothetical protein F5Y14DRAFT_430170 [Nemania sp. NC0429]|nr:hypothetical protein F5Y14DRAFT_430170 [Nemania sp. NC0429]